MAFVYKITSPNGRIYIGSTKCKRIQVRWNQYKCATCTQQIKICRSICKYGIDKHTFEIVWKGEDSERYKMESYYGILYNVLDAKKGLNCRLPKSDDLVYCMSAEERSRRSINMLGKPKSETAKANMRLGWKTRTITPEARTAMIKGKKENTNIRGNSVICTITGKTFISVAKAANYMGYSGSHMRSMLVGIRINITSLIYNK